MRILRQYLLREFLLPWFYCLDAFVLLWLVVDLIGRLDDFIEAHVRFAQAVRYYLVLFPEVLVQILPMSLLLGLLFVLTNLGKHNELLAMRVSGVSLTRLSTPFWMVGLALSLLVLGLNEWFVPGARHRANQLLKEYRGRAVANVVEHLFFTNFAAHRDWYIPRFDVNSTVLFAPEIHERYPDGTASRDSYAE
ncbi:MAG: LptF/LptG family permease, partial [Verrucomicrobiae bacterium]|nr:LptF/LptG family permease [Verrucomicrobiae bacterium]